MESRRLTRSAVAIAALVVSACGGSAPAPTSQLLGQERFVAVPRDVSPAQQATAAQRQGLVAVSQSALSSSSNQSFYLAIRRSELSKRFFLTAYAKQVFPDGVNGGAASTVGTRVVSFRIQNGKLFMFDASDIHTISDAFNPTLVLEAWPIVNGYALFDRDPNSSGYVLIDPSAGLNKFSLFSDAYFNAPPFTVDLSYLENFKSRSDGVSFDQVFTGQATESVHDTSGGEFNTLRISGTLRITLRDYFESKDFTVFAPPPGTPEFYFLSEPRLVPNTGESVQTPVRWNIHPGMKPIRWTISSYVRTLAQDPFYGRYDIAGAIKRGVEAWNGVFGFKALEAVVGNDSSDPGDDSTNFIYVDVNPSLGFAFADWRSNPNTGEIRGASVYFNTIFIDGAASEFDTALARPPLTQVLSGARAAPVRSLGWAGIHDAHACVRPVHPEVGEDFSTVALSRLVRPDAAAQPSGKDLVEAVVTHTILHEVGHTLGLRHNFKGSLEYPSTSAMDYLFDDEGVQVQQPASYDVAAIKYLYGLASTPPTQAFCNDSGTAVDPDCTRFDVYPSPLENWWKPLYRSIIDPFVAGTSNSIASSYTLNSLLAYARAGSAAQRISASTSAFAPVTTSASYSAVSAPRVNFWFNTLQRRLFLDPAASRTSAANSIVQDPPVSTDAALRAQLVGEFSGALRNVNGAQSYATRRTTVDVLKYVQVNDAYAALVQARGEIAANSTPSDLSAQDLLRRIDAAVNPYFK